MKYFSVKCEMILLVELWLWRSCWCLQLNLFL